MSRHQFGERQVVVYKARLGGPRWVAYCPCCDKTLGRFYWHDNAVRGARVHAVREHS